MKKGVLFIVLGALVTIGALVMYQIGNTSSHLSELKDYYYYPLPLACILIAIGIQQLKKNS